MIKDLIYTKPEEAGISSDAISKFVERMKEKKVNLHSFLIAKGGKIVTEGYYKPFDENFKHRLYSCSKTFVALSIGRLIGEGKIRLDDKIMDLLPEYANEAQHKWLKECTVEDALKMSVPQLSDTYMARDYKEWAWTFFNHPTKSKALKPASTVFNYNTSGSFILDVIVEKLTGMTFLEYMRPIFDKIGVSKDIWCVKAPDGYSWGGSGVICTLRDFAKVAELLLHKGEYEGEQLLPRDYMEKATSKQICNIESNAYSTFVTKGYGYQTWITSHGFAMNGMGSQFAFCFPEKDMIFVCQGDTQGAPVGDYIYEQFVHEVYERVQDEPLPVGRAYNRLQAEVENLALNVDYGVAHMPFEKEIDGEEYVLEENPMGWKRFRFDFTGETGTLTYENARGEKCIHFGCNALLKGTFPETHYYGDQVDVPANRELNCLADCSWTEEKKVLLRVYIIDNSFGNCFMTFGFKGNEVGVMMHKTAEFFLQEYVGFAGGRRA